MAVVYKLDGVELDPENVFLRWNDDEEFEGAMAADGTGSFGSVIIHDPDGTLDVQGWMTFTIDETDCTDAPRLVTAWIWERDYARGGDEDTGAARTITCQLLDPNALLSLRVITGTDGNRSAETDGDRVDWLLGSDYLDGLVSDTGYVNGGTSNFDSENEIGRYPAEVLASIASAGISDRVFFAFYDQVAEAIGLFFDLPTATTYDCTLSISNVPADLGSTCFPPFDDVKLNRNPDAVYSDIRYVTKSGVYNRFNSTTRSTFFPSPLLRRGVNVENQRDGSASTSTRHADNYLANHSTERDTITVTIRVPSTQVGLIQAGMRMSIRLSHCPGYETATYARIERMSFHHAEGRRGFYDVTLNLTNKGLASTIGAGGGDPGDFPHPPAGIPSVVQTKFDNTGTLTPDSPITDGNFLIAWITSNAAAGAPSAPTGSSGWTAIATCHNINEFSDPTSIRYGRAFYKVASGEPSSYGFANVSMSFVELTPAEFGASVSHDEQTGTGYNSGGAITPAATDALVIGCGILGQFNPGGATYTVAADTGVTELFDGEQGVAGATPFAWVGYREVAVPASTTVGGTLSNNINPLYNQWAGVTFTVFSTADANLPASGQTVPWTVVTVTPGSTTSTGATVYPYATGSLQVRVDGVLISTASYSETDPATGAFTLNWVIDSDEVVSVTYQGR